MQITLPSVELPPIELPKELWVQISMDNPTTYYKLLQVSKVFKLDTNMMKAKFIKKTVYSDGDIHYTLPNGWLHSCDDQPAAIGAGGDQEWYIDGKIHRDGDKPAVIYTYGGDQCWYTDNSHYWFINGKKHRDNDQPAEIRADGSQFWYIDGKQYTPLT